ncbi:Leucine aminopeptidase 1 [Phlyctochytrium bullatum]|nr:Leucine aminopeptidase 1 [Phlyctochytrium bullatum]
MRVLSFLLALGLSTAAVSAASIGKQQVLFQQEGAVGAAGRNAENGFRLISVAEGHAEWMSEEEILGLIRKNRKFMDITDGDLEHVSTLKAPARYKPPTSPTQQDIVKPLTANISVANLESWLTKFTSFRTRYYQSTTGKQSAEWLYGQVEDVAKGAADGLKITVKKFEHPWPQFSVIARIEATGAVESKEKLPIVVLGAHQDYDDGSGSVTIFEAYRVLVNSGFIPLRPIEFHWYSAEEGGLLGSQKVVAQYKADGVPVAGVFHADMTGWTPEDKDEVIGLSTDFVDGELSSFVKQLVDTYSPIKWADTKCGYACSDHASWTKAGYASAFTFEAAFEDHSPYIHTTNDDVSHIDFEHVAKFSEVVVAFAVEMSLAHGMGNLLSTPQTPPSGATGGASSVDDPSVRDGAQAEALRKEDAFVLRNMLREKWKTKGNQYPICLVHGFAGFGVPLGGALRYWGIIHGGVFNDTKAFLEDLGYKVIVVDIGPVSSNWERACEIYAQLKGTRVDYGLARSTTKDSLDPRVPDDFKGGLYPEWGTSPERKINFICHSMGGTTAAMLITLLKRGSLEEQQATLDGTLSPLFDDKPKSWVNGVVSISSPFRGTTLSDFLSDMTVIGSFAESIVAASGFSPSVYDVKLDHWGLKFVPDKDGSILNYILRLAESRWFKSKSNAFFDLSVAGTQDDINKWFAAICCTANQWNRATVENDVFYFTVQNYVTRNLAGAELPPIESIFFIPSAIMTNIRIPERGVDSEWARNDGIVNTISMTHPYSADGGKYDDQWGERFRLERSYLTTNFELIPKHPPLPGKYYRVGEALAGMNHADVIGIFSGLSPPRKQMIKLAMDEAGDKSALPHPPPPKNPLPIPPSPQPQPAELKNSQRLSTEGQGKERRFLAVDSGMFSDAAALAAPFLLLARNSAALLTATPP